jgi:rSAM/selenodomain-associated transferase 2
MKPGDLAVIVPTLNEAAGVARTLARVRETLAEARIVVVDGGSEDGTAEIARSGGADVRIAPRGRGTQCRHGAAATEERWLLFLHADTLLPQDAGASLVGFMAGEGRHVGTFRQRLAGAGPLVNGLTWIGNRFDSVLTRFGDQGILIERRLYCALGGFPPWPLFEDVELLRRARRVTRVHWLPGVVLTSARRFEEHGYLRQRIRKARLMAGYLLGERPESLAARYAKMKRPPRAADRGGRG